ncbi:NAD(P) transhydrogenase subunit beta, partial [Gordonia paraffinivorans]
MIGSQLLLAADAHTPSEGVGYVVTALYIISFSLFIYGLMGLTGPKTAVRGNWIAATGMGLAVAATLLYIWNSGAVGDDGHSTVGVPTINWILIVVGLALGVVLGIPPALKTKMTAMPQL